MFSKSNLTDMLYRYSKLYKTNIHKEDVQILLESSPIYPSMLSLYRTLYSFEIECSVVRTKIEDIRQLNKPFLAHLKSAKADNIILVKKITERNVIWYNTATSCFHKISTNNFLQAWNGIILYCTNEEICATSHYKYIYVTILSLLAIFLLNTTLWMIIVLNFLGIYCSYSLLIHETGNRNTTLLNKICKVGKHVDCERVTRSTCSRIGNITLADLGLTYFGIALFFSFSLLHNPFGMNINEIYSVLLIGSSPFILYTLCVQLYIKKWCLLCLSLDAIILLETALFWANEKIELPHAITPLFPILYLAPFMLSIVILLKKHSISQKKYIEQKIHSLKTHRIPSIFKLLLRNKTIIRQNEYSLKVGNPDATLTITTWISPYCPYCTEIVKKMFQLIRHKKIRWEIYFAGIDKAENSKYNRLQLYFISLFISDKKRFLNAIGQWYNHNRTTILRQSLQYVEKDKEIEQILDKQMAYAKEIGIKEYPTIFINNRRLPPEYDITDFYYMACDDEIINILNTPKT